MGATVFPVGSGIVSTDFKVLPKVELAKKKKKKPYLEWML
jgi:hypothetical protein